MAKTPTSRIDRLLASIGYGSRTEMARLLFGIDPADSGSIKIDGSTRQVRNPDGVDARQSKPENTPGDAIAVRWHLKLFGR